ncbi:MAG: hypothetical protein CBD51_003095 [Flavobacteriales bacterium TMED191]|nr:MAG: hypothetical protein CBD51_003095 [Flavobacteriales bacterium TMED191]|tara:strand:- start:2675 stop:3760 length:1086 start_codon:yes stop_codon:yes gene_type:complete
MKHKLIMENWRVFCNETKLEEQKARRLIRRRTRRSKSSRLDKYKIKKPSRNTAKKQDLKRPGPNASKAEIEKYNQEVYAKYNSKDGKTFCIPKITNEQQLPDHATRCMRFGKSLNGMVIDPAVDPRYYNLTYEEMGSLKTVFGYQNTGKNSQSRIDISDTDVRTLLKLKKRGGAAFYQGLVWRGFGVADYADLRRKLPGFDDWRRRASKEDLQGLTTEQSFDEMLRYIRDNQDNVHIRNRTPVDEAGYIKFRVERGERHVTSDRISGGVSFSTEKGMARQFAKGGSDHFMSKYRVIIRTAVDSSNSIHVNKTLQKNARYMDVQWDRFGYRKANEGEVLVFGGPNWNSNSIPIDTIYIKVLD